MKPSELVKQTQVDNVMLADNQKAVLIEADLEIKEGKLFSPDVIEYNN
jgi:hypothetical protein